MNQKELLNILPVKIKREIQTINNLQEIRLRTGKPIYLKCAENIYKIEHILTADELQETIDCISDYSLYAYEQELSQGFLTIQGGHRIGIAGDVIMENGKVKNFRHISSMNIRVSHEIKGCARAVIPYIMQNSRPLSTLIVSPPGCGKTTLLRDLIRILSETYDVSVVDERCEIGACYHGVPQNDLGPRTDIMDGCSKAEGMMRMIRSMSPQILAVDEIGTEEDNEALLHAMYCGVTILATAHGNRIAKQNICFQRYILLEYPVGKVEGIYDGEGRRLCG